MRRPGRPGHVTVGLMAGGLPWTWEEIRNRRSGAPQCTCSGEESRGRQGPGVGQGPRKPGRRGPRGLGYGQEERRLEGKWGAGLGPGWSFPLWVSALPPPQPLQTSACALRSRKLIFPV